MFESKTRFAPETRAQKSLECSCIRYESNGEAGKNNNIMSLANDGPDQDPSSSPLDTRIQRTLLANLGIEGKRTRRDSSAPPFFGHVVGDAVSITGDSARRASKPFTWLRHKSLGRRIGTEHSTNMLTENLEEDDVVIALLGALDVNAKYFFINAMSGGNASSSHNIEPHDRKIHYRSFPHPNSADRNVIVVYDLFQAGKVSDSLKSISMWLSHSYSDGKRLSGIIYLEDITTLQPSKLSHKDSKLLENYVGGAANINVSFVTRGWKEVALAIGEQRETELQELWRGFIRRGASLLCFFDTHESARAIVDPIITMADYKTTGPRKAYKGTESKLDDVFMLDPRSTDVVIPIMGPTGVGKSTFINRVADKDVATVGHNLKSQTAQLQHVVLAYPNDPTRRIVLVDTPGFDDTYVPDSEILRRIGVWLARSYTANMKLSGVIYLHEISQTRMLGTSLKNLDMFNKLCGDDGMKNVILATTKWSEVLPEVGARRELQLKDMHWKPMIELGSQLRRFEDSKESGWKIIQTILRNWDNKDAVDTVAVQQELVEIDKILPETEAGRTLRYTLEELLESQRQTAAQLRNDQGNAELRDALEENERKIRTTLQQLRAMRIPFARQLRRLNVLGGPSATRRQVR
ncbi:putative 50S ribosome-binding GTPase [Lyophyllum shimeji]|uniref:50S ribosome-binding GTPase n=1 Tax=Lyophyllum shimeji TaxID=47721 RepID=A0A9P3UQ22_LYOSH|nr:putative 50S ribosome-binding GTPase [Lyophyllum shimeji]